MDKIIKEFKEGNIITFVGSRKTPTRVVDEYQNLAQILVENGCIVRSGNAQGFDQTIAKVPVENREIYLPYANFGTQLKNYQNVFVPKTEFANWNEAVSIVKKLHPNKNLTDIQLLYLARDVYQVLGKDLQTPSDLIICWTEDGASQPHELTRKTGGTAMALRVAFHYNIPVMNIKSNDNTCL